MSAQPYVLATSCAAPDQEFTSLRALAERLQAIRAQAAGRPEISVVPAMLTRCELPGGKVLSIRLLDGSCGGRGAPIGYAFVPNFGRDADALRGMLQRRAVTA